jgi:hypothetical protein
LLGFLTFLRVVHRNRTSDECKQRLVQIRLLSGLDAADLADTASPALLSNLWNPKADLPALSRSEAGSHHAVSRS